ncbi:replication-relaxation family protein, partial [Enterococcus faecalis]
MECSQIGLTKFYYLTKEGHNYIGGYYTLPKVPEYNLQHHLQINDYLIKMLELCNNHPHLKAVVSERRKVYEVKDEKKNQKGVKYFVPDFIFMFLDSIGREVEWQFEIELTLKTKRRYSQGVFPKYIKHLKNYEDARLIYVTPSSIIKEELDMFKEYFIDKEGDEY